MQFKIFSHHQRTIDCAIETARGLFETFVDNDSIFWPTSSWPRDAFNDDQLKIGSIGGHGGTKYKIQHYQPGACLEFSFIYPKGYLGTHEFRLIFLNSSQFLLCHVTNIKTNIYHWMLWQIMIRWVHDALIQDAFDKAELHLMGKIRLKSTWKYRVYLIRHLLGTTRLIKEWLKKFFIPTRDTRAI